MNFLSILAAFSLNGTFFTSTGKNILYTEQGPVSYQDCNVELGIESTASALTIHSLKGNCQSPSYYAFSDHVGELQFKLLSDGTLLLPSGKKAGTFTNDLLSISYDEDGVSLFVETSDGPNGIHLEWSIRSDERLSFDLSADLEKR